jgi:CHAT domain-containing protein/Tfp pilus assembly protein PilF
MFVSSFYSFAGTTTPELTPRNQQATSEIRESLVLEASKQVERELSAGQSHTYYVALETGQYLRVAVNQRGIDTVVDLFAPGGTKLIEMDSPNGTSGREVVEVVADSSGKYRIDVRALRSNAPSGRYELKIEELRAAISQDSSRTGAQRAFIEGTQLRAQQTPQSRRTALAKFEEALSLRRAVEDRAGEAITLFSMGAVYDSLGEKRRALESYSRVLAFWQTIGDRGEQGSIHYTIGAVYRSLGERQKALDSYNEALELRRLVGDRQGESVTLNAIGAVYRSLRENVKALSYYKQASVLRESLGDRRGQATTLNSMGLILRSLGDNQKALEHYSQALSLRQSLGDSVGEAQTLNNMGVAFRWLGEAEKALQHYHQALVLRRAANDPDAEAQTLTNMGVVYSDLGEIETALNYYLEALPLRRAAKDIAGEARTLNYLGLAYLGKSEFEKALYHFGKSLKLEQARRSTSGQAARLNNIGLVYTKTGEMDKALVYYNQALSLYQAAQNQTGEAITLNNIGFVCTSLGENEKGLKYLNQALTLHKAVGNRAGEAITIYNTARTHRNLGNLVEARAQMETVLTFVESLRIKVLSQDLRASFFASVRQGYEFYTDLLMQFHKLYPAEGYEGMALQASERARARSLLDLLTEAQADIRRGIDPSLLDTERSLRQQLNAKAESQLRMLDDEESAENEPSSKKEIEELTSRHREVEAKIRASSARYAALIQPRPLGLKEIQDLLDDDTLLLEYALGADRSYLWAVSSSRMTSYELPKRADVEREARRVYDLLSAREPVLGETPEQQRIRVVKADAESPAATAALSQMLLGPVAAELGNKRLAIVAEGSLLYMPFAALPLPTASNEPAGGDGRSVNSGEQPPLILNHEIISLPSASALAMLRRDFSNRKPATKPIAVLADPVFDKDDDRVTKIARRKGSRPTPHPAVPKEFSHESVYRAVREAGVTGAGVPIPRLPFSREEAETILATAPAGSSLKALGFKANRQTATSIVLSQYRILHFATHALLNNQHPQLSGIVLSLVDERGRPQEGFLRLHDLYNLNLPAELVVLSACQTALGKEIKGEGLVGLTRGFMYAGAPRVVASLWKVGDQSTANLMGMFYQAMLKKGLRPAAALRMAQIQMWKNNRWKAPYHWAGFVLQGEWK